MKSSLLEKFYTEDESFCIVSAFRKGESFGQNESRHHRLVGKIRKIGYAPIELFASFDDAYSIKAIFALGVSQHDFLQIGFNASQEFSLYYMNGVLFLSEIGGWGSTFYFSSFPDPTKKMPQQSLLDYFSKLLGIEKKNFKIFKLQEKDTENSWKETYKFPSKNYHPIDWLLAWEIEFCE